MLYIAMERADLVERRLFAYQVRDELRDLPIAVVRDTIDLMHKGCVDIISDTIKAVEDRSGRAIGLAILDTYAKGIAAGGGDEDKARDQNVVLANMRRVLAQRLDIHFAAIGHTGKDESRGERGSNAKRADMDIQVHVTGDGDIGPPPSRKTTTARSGCSPATRRCGPPRHRRGRRSDPDLHREQGNYRQCPGWG